MPHCIIGSISSGTLLPADLLPVFADTLRDLVTAAGTLDAHKALLDEAEAWQDADEEAEDFDADGHEDDGSEIVNELIDALSGEAPPYFYFGSHPGDGADFGFWLSEDALQDFDGLRVSDTSEVPEDYEGEVLHVNDHGNATLYVAKPGAELSEVWAVV